MNPVEKAEQIARNLAQKSGKDFDALSEAEKERLRSVAFNEVIAKKRSDDH